MRKVYINAQVQIVLNIDEGESVDTALEELNMDSMGDSELVDFNIINYNITDSK